MSKVSFSNTASLTGHTDVVEKVPADALPVNATPAPISVPATVPAQPVAPSTSFRDDDNMDARDYVLPRLNLVQKVGDLSNIFTPGTVVLDGQYVLSDAPPKSEPSKPIRLVVVGFQPTKYFEAVEGGLGGIVCSTLAEVAKNGGTLDYNEAKALGKKWFKSSGTALVLIEKPEGNTLDCFPVTIDGKSYALALWTLKGSGYNKGAKVLKTARKLGKLNAGYTTRFVTVSSQLQKAGANFIYAPVVNVADPTSDAFRADLAKLGVQ